MVVAARAQKGHSRSLSSTIVTGAAGLPQLGSFAAMGMGELGALSGAGRANSPELLELRATPQTSPEPARKLSKKPTHAVPLFMMKSPILDKARRLSAG
jgi:hypothetical protein